MGHYADKPPISPRQEALLVKRLIEACGGLQEASEACAQLGRPYSVPQLSRCATAGTGNHLPLDILAALEWYAGKPVISAALVKRQPVDGSGCVRELSCDFNERAAQVQAFIRSAAADGVLTPREIADGFAQLETAREALAALEAALQAAEAGAPD